MSEYITTGISEFDIKKFIIPFNRQCFNKPYGGLWGCRYNDPNKDNQNENSQIKNYPYASSWIEWCVGESFDADLKTGIIYSLKEDARIYTINSYEDLETIINRYPLKDEAVPTGMFNPAINYKTIQNEYDVIELTEEGQWATRLSHPHSLYGWDVACILILNPDVIINIRPWQQ